MCEDLGILDLEDNQVIDSIDMIKIKNLLLGKKFLKQLMLLI